MNRGLCTLSAQLSSPRMLLTRTFPAPLSPEGTSSGGARLGSSSWPGRFSGEPPSREGPSAERCALYAWNAPPAAQRPCGRTSPGASPSCSATGCNPLATRLRTQAT